MLSELHFGSFATYLPKATSDAEKKAKQWMYWLKSDQILIHPQTKKLISTTRYLAEHLKAIIHTTPLGTILLPEAVLVPVPGSGLQQAGGLWVPERLAKAMVEVGLGGEVFPSIQRISPVQKSAFARTGERPSARVHYESFGVADKNLLRKTSFILIDDVLTRGATMLGAATRLIEAFPASTVVGFGMLRTMGYRLPFVKFIDPTLGIITLNQWGDADRNP
jgi:hypothetical protein